MAYLALFHWGWLLGAWLIGLGMGWISVVHRGRPLSRGTAWLGAVIVATLAAASFTHLLPGRYGYWCDLGLALFALYLVGCAIGTALRAWVISRHAATN